MDRDDRNDKRDDEFKIFVGGLSWQMKEGDLKEAFSKYDPTDATIILDKNTNRPRGFGFVWFKDKLGMEDAVRDMHDKELEGRKISCVRAVPMDQTKPGTPAAALGGGQGSRSRDYGRYPPRDSYGRDYGRGYDRGYDRYAPAGAAGGYDRGYGGYGGADPRYGTYDRGYDSRSYGTGGYGDPYARSHDPYSSGSYGGGYERSYDAYDRGGSGPDRRSYASAPRSGPYDRPSDRRSDGRR